MTVNPAHRRALVAMELANERTRLHRFLGAVADRAIRLYLGEPIASTWETIAAVIRRHVTALADAGAFTYFGLEDAGDLAYVPDVLYAGGEPGLVGVDVTELARLIIRGGTGGEWVLPTDLDLSGAAR